MLTEGQQVKVEGATGDRERFRGRKGKVVRVQKRYEGGLYPLIHVLLDYTKRPHVFLPFELIVDYDDMREMIANLNRGRLRREAMEEIKLLRPVESSIPAIAGIRVYVQGHGGRQYFKKLMPYSDGTLPSSALFDPDNPLSGGWRERKEVAIEQYERNDEEVADFVNEELHKMRRDGKAEKGE